MILIYLRTIFFYYIMESIKGLLLNSTIFSYDNTNTLIATIYTNEDMANIAAYKSDLVCTVEEIEQNDCLIGLNCTHCVKWTGPYAISLAHQIHDLFSFKHTNLFQNAFMNMHNNVPSFKYVLSRPDAIAPVKSHISDSGFDLTIIDEIKQVGDVTFYTTGVKVQPCHGYYFDVVPRSSISKTGYMFANSFGVIDQNYTGDVIIALRKVDMQCDDIQLPCRIAQLIPRMWCHMHSYQVESFEETDRNDGGFGSTT